MASGVDKLAVRDLPPLPRAFYDRDVLVVARELLGCRLIRTVRGGAASGWIVETEAYRGADDPASHAYRGKTTRNASMFGRPGRAYVYTIHAKFCLNAIAQTERTPCGILIRAIEPASGIEQMRRRRRCRDNHQIGSGPAKLCQAMDIDRRLDGWDLTVGRRLWIATDDSAPFERRVTTSPRIGVSAARDRPWRFFINGHRHVSGPRYHHS